MNTKEELRDILEEHHSIVTDELGERLITALDEYIQSRESALLSRIADIIGEDETSEDEVENDLYHATRNGLKQQLRTKLDQLSKEIG